MKTFEETKNNIANSPVFNIVAPLVLGGAALALTVTFPNFAIAGVSLSAIAAVASPMIKNGLIDAGKQIFNYIRKRQKRQNKRTY
jgi:hypothetical protein